MLDTKSPPPSLKRIADRVAGLPEYMGYETQLATLAWTLVQIARSPAAAGLDRRWKTLALGFLDPSGWKEAPEVLEERLLTLYLRVHELTLPNRSEEHGIRRGVQGHSNYPGGILPLLLAGDHVGPETVSIDLGAGNGLQGILLQRMYPHRETIQVELLEGLIARGKAFQAAVGIPASRMTWRHANIAEVSLEGVDFVYLYRPAQPGGAGAEVYRAIARNLARAPSHVVVFSVADCLGRFLGKGFRTCWTRGEVTCFRKRDAGGPGKPGNEASNPLSRR